MLLNGLLKKNVPFKWSLECQKAFLTLKQRFMEESELSMLDQTWLFEIESDTSKYASGAVLTQTDSNGDRHPVAFMSKTFTDTEWQYKIYNRELLGIIWALQEWRHYILKSRHMTMVHMDHKNLTYFRKAQRLSDQQAWWALFLSEFDIKLQHLPGHKLILSNTLLRQPNHCFDDNKIEEQVVLLDDMFLNLLDIGLQEWTPKILTLMSKTQSQFYLKTDQVLSGINWNTGSWRTMMGRRFYSIKERYMCLKTKIFDVIFWSYIMTTKPLATQENWKPTTQYDSNTGGLDYKICKELCEGLQNLSTVQNWQKPITSFFYSSWRG